MSVRCCIRDRRRVYVLRAAEDGAYRGGDQFRRMMQARSLEEWKDAMRLRAHPGSNFIYADAAGNILYHLECGDSRPAPSGRRRSRGARRLRTDEIWTDLHELNALPQLLNRRAATCETRTIDAMADQPSGAA